MSSTPSSSSSAAAAGCPMSAAASPSAAAAPSAVAPSRPQLLSTPVTASARTFLTEQTGAACKQTRAAKIFWNESVAKPTNKVARDVGAQWSVVRQQYPLQIIGGVTAAALALSMPFGRRALFRNTLGALLFSSMSVAPAATIGTLALMRDRAMLSAGIHTPAHVVVQSQPQTQTNKLQ